MQQRVAAVRFPPPARTPEQAVQRAQVAGDAGRQGFRLLPGGLHHLQGVLQAVQVVLRQQVRAARAPQVFQLAGQVCAHALFTPLLQQSADVAGQLFTKPPLLLSHGQPPRQEQAFLGRRGDGAVLLCQLQGNQPAPGQVAG